MKYTVLVNPLFSIFLSLSYKFWKNLRLTHTILHIRLYFSSYKMKGGLDCHQCQLQLRSQVVRLFPV